MRSFLLIFLLLGSAFPFAAQEPADPKPVPVEQERHHRTVLKNDAILVMRVTILEGEQTSYHTHSRDRFAIHLSNAGISEQKLNEPEGSRATTKPGDTSAATAGDKPLTHRIHNFGPGNFDVLDVELFERPMEPSSSMAGVVAAENPSARLYRWTLAPGATSPMHTHARPYLIVAVTKMPLKMTAADGQSFAHEVQAGDFHWVDTKVTHSLANEGTTPGQIVEIELK